MARKSGKSKRAKLTFVRMHEQMAEFSPHQNSQPQGKWGREWMENSRDFETAVNLNESGSYKGRAVFVKRVNTC